MAKAEIADIDDGPVMGLHCIAGVEFGQTVGKYGLPVRAEIEYAAVQQWPLDAAAAFSPEVTARIDDLSATTIEAQLPGERSGPAVRVTLRLDNGSTAPIDDSVLATRYPTPEAYVTAVTESAEAAQAAGFLLEPDAVAFIDAAEASGIGG